MLLIVEKSINAIQDEPFQGCSRIIGVKKTIPLKICLIFLTMIKLGTVIPYPKKIQKKHVIHTTHPLSFADTCISSPENNKFCYTKRNSYIMHFDT